MTNTSPRPAATDLAPRLLPWFDTHARHLPWRFDHDPYRLFVAVIMLQQTQVGTVLPYHERFLKAFPSLDALAAAPSEAVLKLWEGLGYYSRARNLQRAAQIIVEQHDGQFPQTRRELMALPGVGPYTAAALLSISFGQAIAAIDGNVLRILSRVFWLPGGGREGREKKRAEKLAQDAMPQDRPGDYNQALMDLGAAVCTPRKPACPTCPFNDICRANARGQSDAIPKAKRPVTQNARVVAGLIRKRGKILLAQRPQGGVWSGMWELPHVEVLEAEDAAAAMREYIREVFGLEVEVGECCASHVYGIANRRLSLSVVEGAVTGGRLRCRKHDCARWVAPGELDELVMPAPHRKVVEGRFPGER